MLRTQSRAYLAIIGRDWEAGPLCLTFLKSPPFSRLFLPEAEPHLSLSPHGLSGSEFLLGRGQVRFCFRLLHVVGRPGLEPVRTETLIHRLGAVFR